jgi:2,3-bisphosphoglycerate-dependent phosphoglycerate mutase
MKNREYYFIRHGLPLNDIGSFHLSAFDRDMQGETDEPLSDKGIHQATALREVLLNLDIQRIVSSTLKRAVHTASVIASETGIPFDRRFKRLSEINLGGYPVKKTAPIQFLLAKWWPHPIRKLIDRGVASAATVFYFLQWHLGNTIGGESHDEINRKIVEMLFELDAFPESRIAVVCHAGWISFMAVKILGGSLWNFLKLSRVDNCSITRIDADGEGEYQLRFFALSHESIPL